MVPCPKRELTVFGVIPASRQRVANVCLKICAESLGQSNSYPLFFAFSIQYPNELLKPVRLYASPNDDTKIRSSLIDDFPLYIFPSSGFLFLMFLSSISYAVLLLNTKLNKKKNKENSQNKRKSLIKVNE